MAGVPRDNVIVYKFGQEFYYVDQGSPSKLFLEHRTMIQDLLDSEVPGAYSVNISKSPFSGRVGIRTRKIA